MGIVINTHSSEKSEIRSEKFHNLIFKQISIDSHEEMEQLFKSQHFDRVINLAAQAGVRYSITNPYSYLRSNLDGFLCILECCRQNNIQHLVFASSSSIYGLNTKVPFSEDDEVNAPASLYAATKRSDEMMAHSYSKLYGIPISALRYFTVYGPWGRPDMAPMIFTKNILAGIPIKVFNNGKLSRDFTYIDDIVEGTIRLLDHIPNAESLPNKVPFSIYNIGQGHPVQLMDFIATLEEVIGRRAIKEYLPMQAGDVYCTYADTSKLQKAIGYRPQIDIHQGIENFVRWYQSPLNPLLESQL
jgi:UDP-glucuronate 4-epimerase